LNRLVHLKADMIGCGFVKNRLGADKKLQVRQLLEEWLSAFFIESFVANSI